MGRKKGAPVVITRKDKRLNKTGHLLAFMLTGGASSVYTATKAATNAGYNARTRKLVEQAEAEDATEFRPPEYAPSDEEYAEYAESLDCAAEFRAEHVPGSKEYKARHGKPQ